LPVNTDARLTTWPVVGALICWPFRSKCQHGDSGLVYVGEKNEVIRLWNAYRNRGIELIEQVAQQFWVNAGSQRIGLEPRMDAPAGRHCPKDRREQCIDVINGAGRRSA